MQNCNSKFRILTFCIVIFIFAFLIFNFVYAATNIDVTYKYAWNDNIGWIDFGTNNTVVVSVNQLDGYADSAVGPIALNCASSPVPNCSIPYKISNDGNGNLTGWAWNDSIGWISFDSGTATSSYPYQVVINGSTGDFTGWAWNDSIGWISFNCSNTNTCPPPSDSSHIDYKVKTSWRAAPKYGYLESSIFDTQVVGGSAINTIMWRGTQPSGTAVKFQVASANSADGPWNYLGPDGTDQTFYAPSAPDMPVQINLAQHNNKRYFRYKATLVSNLAQTTSSIVDDIIINWSP